MATVPRLGTEAPSLVTLRTTIYFRKFLTIVSSFAPASGRAGGVTRWAFSFRRCEVVHVYVRRVLTGQNFFPIYGLDVAQIVIVEEPHASLQDIWTNREHESKSIVKS